MACLRLILGTGLVVPIALLLVAQDANARDYFPGVTAPAGTVGKPTFDALRKERLGPERTFRLREWREHGEF